MLSYEGSISCVRWFRQQGNALSRMYDREIKRHRTVSHKLRRRPLLTPEALSAIASCASSHSRVARVLATEAPTPDYVPGPRPHGQWLVGKIEDGATRYVARCWERHAHGPESDQALRDAYASRVQMTLHMG